MSEKSYVSKVSLKEEERQGSVHYFIEKFILWRLQNWKNNPRVNALIWKAVLSVFSMTTIGVFIAFVLYIVFALLDPTKTFETHRILTDLSKVYLKSWVKFGFVFTGSITLAYWNMSTMFNKKWTYCADLYNKILTLSSNEKTARDLLRNALAIDLLTLDLWAHRSFATLFAMELMVAIDFAHEASVASTEKNRALSGYFSESEALRVLEARNVKLSGGLNVQPTNINL